VRQHKFLHASLRGDLASSVGASKRFFRQALQVRPDYVEARRSLEMALTEMGQSR